MGVQLESTSGCASQFWSICKKSLTDNCLTKLFTANWTPKEDFTKTLPLEIKVMILEHCSRSDLLAVRSMSREWRDAVKGVKEVDIHPLAWAIITDSNLTIQNKIQASVQYISKGPYGLGRESALFFIKEEGVIEVNDSQALLKPHELSSEYYLSPWWIFQECVGKKRIWQSPRLNDDKGQYFKKLIKGIECPLQHVSNGYSTSKEYYIQSICPTLTPNCDL